MNLTLSQLLVVEDVIAGQCTVPDLRLGPCSGWKQDVVAPLVNRLEVDVLLPIAQLVGRELVLDDLHVCDDPRGSAFLVVSDHVVVLVCNVPSLTWDIQLVNLWLLMLTVSWLRVESDRARVHMCLLLLV